MGWSEDEITKVVAQGGYTPAKIPKLEEYLLQVCSGDAPYVFDAVRVLVKLYLLFPSHSNATNMAYVSLATIINDMDKLQALQYLIPMETQKQEPCRTIFECSELLSTCRYKEFWSTYDSLQQSSYPVIQKMAQSSVPKLQAAVLQTLALSYRNAPLPFVLQSLNTKSLPDQSLCSVSGDKVVFTATADNTKRERVYQEGISFSTVTSLLQKMAQ